MLKKLILLFVLFSPVVQIVLISLSFGEGRGEAFAQIVIKDEIVLDEITPDAVTLSTVTPAYGRLDLWYVINPTYYRSKVTAQIGDLTVFVYGQSYDCPGSGGNTGDYVTMHWFDIPAGTPISMEVITCINEEWVNCPVSFGTWEQEGDFYYLDYTVQYGGDNIDNAEGNDNLVTNQLRVWAYSPPGCDNAPPCNSLPIPPNIELSVKPNFFGNVNVCSETGTAAGFQPVGGPFVDLNSIIPEVCYNSQTQTWQYKFSNGHTIIFNVVIGYCPFNINVWGGNLINDYEDFPTNYSCENIVRDLLNHLYYPVKVKLTGSYVLKSILEEHELEHAQYFKNILERLKDEYFNDMYKDLKNCNEIPTVQSAISYFTAINDVYLTRYWDKACETNEIETGLSGIKDDWLREKIIYAHEQRTHLKIYRFIFQKIIAVRIYHGCVL